jgi:hypothetical protein
MPGVAARRDAGTPTRASLGGREYLTVAAPAIRGVNRAPVDVLARIV